MVGVCSKNVFLHYISLTGNTEIQDTSRQIIIQFAVGEIKQNVLGTPFSVKIFNPSTFKMCNILLAVLELIYKNPNSSILLMKTNIHDIHTITKAKQNNLGNLVFFNLEHSKKSIFIRTMYLIFSIKSTIKLFFSVAQPFFTLQTDICWNYLRFLGNMELLP